jgi:hypothetical protein
MVWLVGRRKVSNAATGVVSNAMGSKEDGAGDQKRNLKTPIKTRTLHLSEPYDSRSTTHTGMQPRKDKS